jgi:hypothetical protein
MDVRSGPGAEPAEAHVKDVALMHAIKAAIEAHPGDRPVTLRMEGVRVEGGKGMVEVPTGLRMSGVPAARNALARLVGAKNVEGF